MVFATFGWAVWWVTAALLRFAPEWTPSFLAASIAASTFAVVGLALAVFSFRGKRNWMLLSLVPLFANASLLALPSLLEDLNYPAGEAGGSGD